MSTVLEADEASPSAGHPRPASRMVPAEWMLLLVLAAVQFTHIVDFIIVMPLGPVFIKEMHIDMKQFGYVVGAYAIAAGIASLLAARILDRVDRKSALLVLYSGFTVGTFLCAFAPNYGTLLAARAIAGGFGGVAASVVLAIVGDAFPDARRGTAFGVVMSSFSVGTIAGLPLGLGFAEAYGWHMPFIILGTLSVVVLLIAAVLLKPMRGHLGRGHQGPTMGQLICNPNHIRAYLLTVALVFASFMVFPYLATYLEYNVGFQHGNLKYMYLFGGLATLVTMNVFGRIADRYGKLITFRVLAIATAGILIWATNLPAGHPTWMVLLATTVCMIVTSGRMVPAQALIANSATNDERGGFMSLNSAVQHLASGAAAALAGIIVTRPGDDGPLKGYPMVGIVACFSTLVSLYLAGRLRPARKTGVLR